MVRPFRHPVNAADLPARHRSPENPFTVKAKRGQRLMAAALGSWALCNQRQSTICKPDRGPLGLAGVAKQLTFYPVEAVRGGEKPVAAGIAHDDSRSLRADFDDVSV